MTALRRGPPSDPDVRRPRLFAFTAGSPSEGLSLFPAERGGGISFSNDEIVRQSVVFSHIYQLIIERLAAAQSSVQGLPPASCAVLMRTAAVPIVHFFLDRALRLSHLLARAGAMEIAGAKQVPPPDTIDRFCLLAGKSAAFNQEVLARMAPCFHLPVSTDVVVCDAPVDLAGNAPGFVNHLFFFPRHGFRRRLVHRAIRAWSRRTGAVGAASMVNVQVPLAHHGLYGYRLLANMDRDVAYRSAPVDDRLRESVLRQALGDDRNARNALHGHLGQLGWPDPAPVESLLEALAAFLSTHLPPSLLEAASQNLRLARRQFGRFRAVICGSLGFATQPAYLVAACKALNIPVLGMQHGGHYGYSDQHVGAYEGEYATCDGFITWGWSALPDHPAIAHQRTYPLPSPWLSERVDYWQEVLSEHDRAGSGKPFDILLMPNKLYPFPPSPSGSHATVNHIEEFAATLSALITGAGERGLRVLHKPYNRITKDLLRETLGRLSGAGHEYHQYASELEKGLTPALVRQCGVIVWDQPGTGFLECLTAGIPTMVLWTRLFNSEAPWAHGAFQALERAALVHRSVGSLLREACIFKVNPRGWIADEARRKAAAEFCRTYAWTSSDWPKHWRNLIVRLRDPA